MSSEFDRAEFRKLAGAVLDEVGRAVLGKRDVLELVFAALLADGHVLIEDKPGLAKTLMARSFATASGLQFRRVQFTPDLMPGDITGGSIYDQRESRFEFQSGPLFTEVLLADEINRAPPKTQAALLEAMAERQVTVDGETRPLGPPFLVLATENPIEYEGTYPLPEAQLDRFIARITMGYPSEQDEKRVLLERAGRKFEQVQLSAVIGREQLLWMQQTVGGVEVDDDLAGYMVALVAATRVHPGLQVGASPRGSLALLALSRAKAALCGRDFVTPDDVKAVAVPALSHRLVLKPELWVQAVAADRVVEECLRSVPIPPAQCRDPEDAGAAVG